LPRVFAKHSAPKTRGGELYFPAGKYLCGAIELISNSTILPDDDAVSKASENIADHYLGIQLLASKH